MMWPDMSDPTQLVVFRLDEQLYALPLAVVERVVRAVEITPLPKAPSIVLGVIDVEGQVLPVLNIRRRFQLSEREIGPDDQFLIAHTARHKVVLAINEAMGVIKRLSTQIVDLAQIAPGLEQFQGVVKLDDGMALIHDLEGFLSLTEVEALAVAMSQEVADAS